VLCGQDDVAGQPLDDFLWQFIVLLVVDQFLYL
jgi:hypothetical protein